MNSFMDSVLLGTTLLFSFGAALVVQKGTLDIILKVMAYKQQILAESNTNAGPVRGPKRIIFKRWS